MPTIITRSNKAEREIELPLPTILTEETLDGLVATLTEDVLVKLVQGQLKIMFRSHIRTKLESETDGDFTNSDEDITALDFSDWKPEARTRMTAQEKAMASLSKLTPEEIKAVLAQAAAQAEEE